MTKFQEKNRIQLKMIKTWDKRELKGIYIVMEKYGKNSVYQKCWQIAPVVSTHKKIIEIYCDNYRQIRLLE